MKEKQISIAKKMWDFLKPKLWYIFLLILSTVYLLYYHFDIYELSPINARNLVFLLWILLLLLPLFSEMEFLGIKVKKAVEKATGEVKEELKNIQSQLQMTAISTNSSASINFSNSPLPSEQQLHELTELLHQIQDKNSAPGHIENISNNNDDKNVYLFKIRLEIESALRKLCEKIGYAEKTSAMQMVRFLGQKEVLPGMTIDLISQVIRIANRGVHGEIVSDEYIQFVKSAYPEILRQIKNFSDQLRYVTCPRCHFTGYSKYDDLCPQCGYAFDS